MNDERTMERLVRRAFVFRALARCLGTPGPDDAAEVRRAASILRDELASAGSGDHCGDSTEVAAHTASDGDRKSVV